MLKWFNRQFPPLVWSFLIFLGSSLPAAQVSENQAINLLAHKIAHLLEYGVLYLLYYRSQVDDLWHVKKSRILKALLFVVLFGAFDEYHQSFVPGRQSRVADVLTDFMGGLGGLILWWFLRQRRRREQKS